MSLVMDVNRRRWTVLWAWIVIGASTLSDVSAQQQTFRKRPQDTEVRLGETAVLNCEIENQAGPAQWTKDGFALGFSREIAGFSRYTMTGEANIGVHNLRIVNVTMKDIAEYQCQVGPMKNSKAIRSDAKLNVLVPPKSIEIINHAPNAKITLKEKEQTQLECVVREARPAAVIVWYKNKKAIRMEEREDTIEELEVVVDDVRVKKNTTRSKIKFHPTSEDDGSTYTCEAQQKAITGNLKVSVLLSVQYPPGAPRIDGYREGDTIRENQAVNLICVSRLGNPLAELIWFKNDVRIDSSYYTSNTESRNELKFLAKTTDDLARFRCEARNVMSPTPKLADVVLTVNFAPKEVKIVGPGEVKVGDMVSLTCMTNNSNPRAEIAWFKGGNPLEASHTTSRESPDGGYITTSNVTFKIESEDQSLTVACHGKNIVLGESKATSHVINVIQPPAKPYIYRVSPNITAGTMHRIHCASTGGHPVAALTWFRGDKKVDSEYRKEGNGAIAELVVEANASDNGVTYRCEAKNKALTTPLSDAITFSVLFPPSVVHITTKPKKLKEGEKAYLTCESTSSNPPAFVSWTKDSVVIPSQSNSSKEGEYGGKKTVATLELDLTSELDNAVYTCKAYNDAVKKSVHDSTTLQVDYKPKFFNGPGDKVSVKEGDPKVIILQAKGNPSSIKYKWSRNGTQLKPVLRKLVVDGPVLNFTSVDRKDKGKYDCQAKNDEGSTVFTVELDVQYAASLQKMPEYTMVGLGDEAVLECVINANPLLESHVKWTREDSSSLGDTAEVKFRDNKSYLTISKVESKDAGRYSCYVDNGIGKAVNESIYLIVKHKPEIDLSPQIAKAASESGGIGKLICRAKGAPNVTFSWSREGVRISPAANADKYSITYKKVDFMTYESNLEVNDVNKDDYGPYECIARNELADVMHVIHLNVNSIPESPTSFRVINFTHDSVELAWRPGFDGGFEQAFEILYRKVGSENVRTVYVLPPNATSFTVTQLALGTEYSFSVRATNRKGSSNITAESVTQETSKIGPVSYTTSREDEFTTHPFSRLVISVFIIVGATMLLINVLLIACFLKRRSKKRLTAASEQGSSKSATIEMYAPSSYNETVTGETLSSISEKSATYSHGENHDEYIEDGGKGTGVSTYLVDQINHHSSGYPYREMGGLRASTLPRQPKQHHVGSPLDTHHVHHHHEDDGYVDALRRNAYNQGIGDKAPIYGRTTPRPSSRPPQVPPIPELYNIPPEARYVPCPPPGFGSPMGNGSIRHLPHSASHNMLNSSSNSLSPQNPSFHQPNGRLITSNGPLSPGRSSILTTFAPNPSPNNMEHEGHLV